MKKIGLLIDTMNSNGAQRVVSHLTHILNGTYDVHLILFQDSYMEYDCAGTIHSLGVPAQQGNLLTKMGLFLRRIRQLKKVIREEELFCVVSFLETPNFVNLLAHVPNCRKIVSIRNYTSAGVGKGRFGKLMVGAIKMLYRKADCVIPVTKLIEKDYRENYGIRPERLFTIYNPYNFDEMLEKSQIPLTEAGKSFYDAGFVFVNVGRIVYQKAVWHLVKAFSMVHKAHPYARLVIVGEDYTQGKLTALIDQLGVADNVLLTGRTRNPFQYMKNADCYVLPSLFEGFPNAMVEGMACGCATVAADCMSGPREILYENADLDASINAVTEADFGILVPALEPEENWDPAVITEGEKMLAQAMETVLSDPEKCRELARKAQQRSRTFDYDAAREAFKSVIEGK